MLKQTTYSLLLSIWTLSMSACQQNAESFSPEIQKQLETADYHVWVTYSNECPFCIRYTQNLRDIRDSLPKNWSFKFLKVLPNETWNFDWSQNLSGEIIHDSTLQFVKRFGLKVYPEALVLDANGNVLYKGAIDDRAHEIGLSRTVVQHTFLAKAIAHIQSKKETPIKFQSANGCYIEEYVAH